MKKLVPLALALLASTIASASPHPYFQPEPPGAWMSVAGKGSDRDPVEVAVIFVDFPNTVAGQGVINQNVQNMLAGVESSFLAQSRGAHALNFSIVPDPRSATAMWRADHLSGLYNSLANVLNLPPQWQGCWAGGGDYSYMGELQHEILGEIQSVYNSYYGQGNWDSPLSGADAVVFICKPDSMPGGGDGNPLSQAGWGGLSALYATVGCSGQDAILSGAPGTGTLYGWIANWWNTNDLTDASFVMAHEWGHKLLSANAFTTSDGHPAPTEVTGIPTADHCLYGAYEVMRARYLPGEQFPYFNPWEQYRLGWVTPVVVEQNLRELLLTDFRETGACYIVPVREHEQVFNLPPPNGAATYTREYYLVAYHNGNYEFFAPDDEGLMIWHVIDQVLDRWYDNPPAWMAGLQPPTQFVSDLEIASGMFADPSNSPGHWTMPDWADGWDNLDDWIDVATGQPRTDYISYRGSNEDLLTLNGVSEFSFRTSSNPRSFGYNWTYPLPVLAPALAALRTSLQTAPNSVMIRIKSEQSGGVIVDLLRAPYEDVTDPNGGEILLVGDPVTITWAHSIAEINTVDILYSADDGATYPSGLTIATGVSASAGQYVWTPGANQTSVTGKIKIVFHNTRDLNQIGEDESDESFAVLERSDSVYANRSAETGLDYAGSPYSSVGVDYDYNPQGQRNLEDLMITIGSGASNSALFHATGLSENEVPEFEELTLTVFPQEAIRPQDGLGGVSVADMDNDGDLDMFCASGLSELPSVPRLYRNNGNGTYADVTQALGLSQLAANSWAGTWADYDRDGWVDLLIARGGDEGVPPESMTGRPAYLLRNKLDPINLVPTFQDVTAAVGLSTGGANIAASISACWGDVNGDNRLDLYLAEYAEPVSGPRSKLFVQQTNGTFTEEGLSRLPIPSTMLSHAAAQFADMDLDGDADLVVGARILSSGAFVFWNNGSGYFTSQTPLTVPSVGGVSGMKIWDQDLDGRPDLLLTTRDPQQTSHFFHNLQTTSGVVLVDETSHVGLDVGHACGGLTTLDWNRDGDKDVFLGRPVSTGQIFYRAERENGTDNPAKNTVSVRLSSPQAVNNRAGIGARVSVEIGGVWYHQWVDGGSGRGGQDDLALTFAVPSSTETYPVAVRWPNGWTQTVTATINRENLDPEVILDNTNPTVVNSTVVGSTAINAQNGLFYWVFSWETEYRSDWLLDSVTVYSSACVPNTTTYTATMYGVQPTVTRQSSGRYWHELRFRMDCNAPCTIPFTVSSSHRAGITSTSTPQKTLKIKFCPSQL